MRQSDRRKILWFLVLLFVLAGGAAIFYAQGYRLNLSPLGIEKIGAIYVKSFPGNASVFLDGKPAGKTFHFFGTGFLFLQGGTLVNGLFPGKYVLSLKMEGYEDWKQTMEVKPALVSEAKYAVLTPKTSVMAATTSVSDFWIAGGSAVAQTPYGALKSSGQTLPGTKVLDQGEDGRVLVSDKNNNLFEINLTNGSTVNVTALMRANGIAGRQFLKIVLDQGENGLLLTGGRNVYVLNLDSGMLQVVSRVSSPPNTIAYAAASPALIASSEYDAVKNISLISVYDKNFQSTSTYALPLTGKTVKMDWKGNQLGVLQSDGSLFFGDPRRDNGLSGIASDALSFSFTDNLDLVAVRETSAFEVISLSGNQDDYARFSLPQPDRIQNIFWYSDGHHLFVSYPEKTMFLDTNDRNLEHFAEVGSAGAKYMRSTNELYFLTNGVLMKIIFPS